VATGEVVPELGSPAAQWPVEAPAVGVRERWWQRDKEGSYEG